MDLSLALVYARQVRSYMRVKLLIQGRERPCLTVYHPTSASEDEPTSAYRGRSWIAWLRNAEVRSLDVLDSGRFTRSYRESNGRRICENEWTDLQGHKRPSSSSLSRPSPFFVPEHTNISLVPSFSVPELANIRSGEVFGVRSVREDERAARGLPRRLWRVPALFRLTRPLIHPLPSIGVLGSAYRKTSTRQCDLSTFSTPLVDAGSFWRSCEESGGRSVCENERTDLQDRERPSSSSLSRPGPFPSQKTPNIPLSPSFSSPRTPPTHPLLSLRVHSSASFASQDQQAAARSLDALDFARGCQEVWEVVRGVWRAEALRKREDVYKTTRGYPRRPRRAPASTFRLRGPPHRPASLGVLGEAGFVLHDQLAEARSLSVVGGCWEVLEIARGHHPPPQEASLVVYRPPQHRLPASNGSQHASVNSRGSKDRLKASKHQHEIEPVSTPLAGPEGCWSSLRESGRRRACGSRGGGSVKVRLTLFLSFLRASAEKLWAVSDRPRPSPPRSRRLGRRQRALASLEGGGPAPFVLRESEAAAGVVGCGGAVGGLCEAGEVVGMRMGRPHRAKGVSEDLRLDTRAFLYTLCVELGGLWSSEALHGAFSSSGKKTASSRYLSKVQERPFALCQQGSTWDAVSCVGVLGRGCEATGVAGIQSRLNSWLEDTPGARIAGVGLWDRLALAWTISVRPITSLPPLQRPRTRHPFSTSQNVQQGEGSRLRALWALVVPQCLRGGKVDWDVKLLSEAAC
ncbi:LOW QUALITY PROTEIN: hypothetical protein CVT26_006120 [Gymnopilus dilepis]|uniref:Uncharacterized protein n=1 Tax=Gymnopilus dilepis TaxID=231916 RepID=A0A409YKM5_9AGAR|nr:LOW QUALITY PROTEIN: hypothetical protein CVT26_006120 [Gymnopilus dilepis]